VSTAVVALVAIDHAGYILGSYAVTIAVIAGLAWRVIRRSRQLAAQVDDADKNWT
jgi:heme exporter protein CcmD